MRNYDLQTDTHLSKDFNKILQSLMYQCNITSMSVESNPHYDYLLQYQAAVNNLFKNTFFLFDNINQDGTTLTQALMNNMRDIKLGIYRMKYDPSAMNRVFFDEVLERCNWVHMLIMYGLQQRKMLVRMSESEPKGKDSLKYWDTKTIFKKDDMKVVRSKSVIGNIG